MKRILLAAFGVVALGACHADAGLRPVQGHGLLPGADPARRIPDRLGERARDVPEAGRLRDEDAQRRQQDRRAAIADERRHRAEARGDHPRRRRFQCAEAVDRGGARRRHPGHRVRPPDHLDHVRLHLGRRHGRDRLCRRRAGAKTADGEERLGQGQDPAGARRSGRSLHARHPEGLRGEDEGVPGRQDHLAAGHAVGSRATPAPSSPTRCSPIPTST